MFCLASEKIRERKFTCINFLQNSQAWRNILLVWESGFLVVFAISVSGKVKRVFFLLFVCWEKVFFSLFLFILLMWKFTCIIFLQISLTRWKISVLVFFFFLVISFSDLPLVFILNLGGFFRFLFGLCENAGKGNQSWVLVTFVGLFDVKTPPLLSIQLGHPSANFLVAQKMQERDKFAQLFYCFFFFLF